MLPDSGRHRLGYSLFVSGVRQAPRLGRVGQEGDFEQTGRRLRGMPIGQDDSEVALLHAAVLDSCDALDALQNGLREGAAPGIGLARHPDFGSVGLRILEAVEMDREEEV